MALTVLGSRESKVCQDAAKSEILVQQTCLLFHVWVAEASCAGIQAGDEGEGEREKKH